MLLAGKTSVIKICPFDNLYVCNIISPFFSMHVDHDLHMFFSCH